jgi:hypothetical protein
MAVPSGSSGPRDRAAVDRLVDYTRRCQLPASRAIDYPRICSSRQMPLAGRRIGREPVWRPATIRKWQRQRSRQAHSHAEPTAQTSQMAAWHGRLTPAFP